MEIIQPPHTVLETTRHSESARVALSLVEQDMAASAKWTGFLRRALQGAMQQAAGSLGQVLSQGQGVPPAPCSIPGIRLPVDLVNRCVAQLKGKDSSRRQKQQEKKKHGTKRRSKAESPIPTAVATAAGSKPGGLFFAKGFLSDSSKGRKQRRKEREQKATQHAVLSAAAVALAAAGAAARVASKATKAAEKRKKKRRKFKSLMADLMAPTASASATLEQRPAKERDEKERLVQANPKIEFSKLDRI